MCTLKSRTVPSIPMTYLFFRWKIYSATPQPARDTCNFLFRQEAVFPHFVSSSLSDCKLHDGNEWHYLHCNELIQVMEAQIFWRELTVVNLRCYWENKQAITGIWQLNFPAEKYERGMPKSVSPNYLLRNPKYHLKTNKDLLCILNIYIYNVGGKI